MYNRAPYLAPCYELLRLSHAVILLFYFFKEARLIEEQGVSDGVFVVSRVKARGRARTQNGLGGCNRTKGTTEREGGNANSRSEGQNRLIWTMKDAGNDEQ